MIWSLRVQAEQKQVESIKSWKIGKQQGREANEGQGKESNRFCCRNKDQRHKMSEVEQSYNPH